MVFHNIILKIFSVMWFRYKNMRIFEYIIHIKYTNISVVSKINSVRLLYDCITFSSKLKSPKEVKVNQHYYLKDF